MPEVKRSAWKSGSVVSGIVWLLTYIGVRAAVESPEGFSQPVLIAIVLVPVIPAAVFLFYFITEMRQVDELQRRIQLEALAFAYPLTILMLITLGLLQLVINLNPADWSYRHVWQFVVVFYLFGIGIATRRYR